MSHGAAAPPAATDHILAGLIVAAAGVDPLRTNYIAFSGGGEAVTALLGGQVTAGISGYSEFAAAYRVGRLRAIGISAADAFSPSRCTDLVEQGLDVELENWRAVMAPPGLTDAETHGRSPASSIAWRTATRGGRELTKLGWSRLVSRRAGTRAIPGRRADTRRRGIVLWPARYRRRRQRADRGVGARRCWCSPARDGFFVALFLERRSAAAVQREPTTKPAGVVTDAGSDGAFRQSDARRGRVRSRSSALLNPAGFIAAGTALFACTASAFGSTRWLRRRARWIHTLRHRSISLSPMASMSRCLPAYPWITLKHSQTLTAEDASSAFSAVVVFCN